VRSARTLRLARAACDALEASARVALEASARAAMKAATLATLALLAGCDGDLPAPPLSTAAAPAKVATTDPAQHELGRKIWNFRCYFCHGYSGNARTLAATYLQPPPRDFTHTPAASLSLEAMVQAITHGRPGTAMKGFAGILQPAEVLAVAGFVKREFIEANAENTRYHTAENGWPDHERHRDAFAFAKGELALDTPWEQLDAAQQRGKRLFLSACVTCHDHGRTDQPGAVWETQALSYPRDAYCTSCHERADGGGTRPQGPPPAGHPPVRERTAGSWPGSRAGDATQAVARVAGTYRAHDTPPPLPGADARERRGEALFQGNCAFCHAADGTAKSWIGRFLEPHPRDLTDPRVMAGMTRGRLAKVIEDGLEGTSMPGWKQVLRPEEIDAVVAYIHRAFHPVRGG
jgi:cytochrome c oxidase cbb3-type subunit 3